MFWWHWASVIWSLDFEPEELCVLPPPSWNLNDCNFGGTVVSWISSWKAANRFSLLPWLMFTLSENNNLLTELDWLITLGRENTKRAWYYPKIVLVWNCCNWFLVEIIWWFCVCVSYLPPDRCSGTRSCGAGRWCFVLHTPCRHPPAALNPRWSHSRASVWHTHKQMLRKHAVSLTACWQYELNFTHFLAKALETSDLSFCFVSAVQSP